MSTIRTFAQPLNLTPQTLTLKGMKKMDDNPELPTVPRSKGSRWSSACAPLCRQIPGFLFKKESTCPAALASNGRSRGHQTATKPALALLRDRTRISRMRPRWRVKNEHDRHVPNTSDFYPLCPSLWIRRPCQHLGSIHRHRLLSHPRSNVAMARGHAQKSLRQFCMEAGSLEEVASRPCMERQGYVDRFSMDR